MTDSTEQLQVRQQTSDGWQWWEFRVMRDEVEVARSGGYPTEQDAIDAGFIFMGFDVYADEPA